MNHAERKNLAEETVRILKSGAYINSSGQSVDIHADLQRSVDGSRTILPEQWPELIAGVRAQHAKNGTGRIEVTSETTLEALYRLVARENAAGTAALNFASAKNPGGGFLGGARAQEESLARSSGLYGTLLPHQTYYSHNRACRSLLYSDHAIHSPLVPVFRDDNGRLIDRPYLATFITMPAPNLGAMAPDSAERAGISATLRRRIDSVFALAASTGSRHLVLGAWGCGAFRNDPDIVAPLFADALAGPDSWRLYFDQLVFAVFDPKEPAVNRPPFERCLLGLDASLVS